MIMETALYYNNNELLSPEKAELLRNVWGKENRTGHKIEEKIVDHNYGTGLHLVTNIMATIQCDRALSERDQQLRDRIASKNGKLTPTQVYGSKSVEHNIFRTIIVDAVYELKNNLDADEIRDLRLGFSWLPWNELHRMYALPYEGALESFDMKRRLEKIEHITKPDHFFDLGEHVTDFYQDGNSIYKQYNIKYSKMFFSLNDVTKNCTINNMPFVGKVYDARRYLQVYVYDHYDRHWALQHVLNHICSKDTKIPNIPWN